MNDISVETYVDTLGMRIECQDRYDRDNLFRNLMHFIGEQHLVGTVYDEKRSNKYYQTTKLQYGNSTLSTISKGYFEQTSKSGYKAEYYYINISFYGLMRYNKTKDDASLLLVKTIAAYLNTNNIHSLLIEVDIAIDIREKLDKLVAVCNRRTANVSYNELGVTDANGDAIQKYYGTYYIEKFSTHKQKKNAMSRAYHYDKRKKEIDKFNRDIGFELSRFELKLQKRYFLKNAYDGSSLYKAIGKYSILHFDDLKNKELFIQRYNTANSSRKRRRVISDACDSSKASILTPRLNKVYKFLRMIDSVTFDAQGAFKYVKHEDYLYCKSKFNYKFRI